jgi:hypothetical protein
MPWRVRLRGPCSYSTRPVARLQGLDASAPFAKATAELLRERQLQQQLMLAEFITESYLSPTSGACGASAARAARACSKRCTAASAGRLAMLHLPDGVDALASGGALPVCRPFGSCTVRRRRTQPTFGIEHTAQPGA